MCVGETLKTVSWGLLPLPHQASSQPGRQTRTWRASNKGLECSHQALSQKITSNSLGSGGKATSPEG